MEVAPSWLVSKAIQKEHTDNWSSAYKEINKHDVQVGWNIIGSHIVYKIKSEENGLLRLKAGICPHGNHDSEKNDVRKDSATAQFVVTRLMLALVTMLPFRLGVVDIKGAYLQIGPIRREIYVRPPQELASLRRGYIWHLTKLPYGITEAGRQGAITIETWLVKDMGMEPVFSVSQLFVKRGGLTDC